ncbi:PTS transporter subunit IIC [Sporolactobacillus laevolacticus]|uniref:PTS transporter subunit IIC n=1 Tax=Sporolactobacillus laevolacticus TaxID=33018 RepID=UPI0025B3EACE|nr:PTS sugar transporter subunit IIC [Sporolactobacillus laevolacticus]MDN3955022.1 PTS sugar transporter subunit IIC [Sporolactobacillus laevolacticus]
MLKLEKEKMTVKAFVNNVLVGHAVGIVAALVPSALLGELSKALMGRMPIFGIIYQLVTIFTLAVPLLIGAAVAFQFKMKPIPMVCVAAAAWAGSGALKFTPNGIVINGMGDLVNILVTISLTCGLVLLIGGHLKSFEPLVMPPIICTVGGGIGLAVYPIVHAITVGLGEIINSFSVLQPIPMGILIAVAFSVIMISPVSTVGIATAIGMSGIASGAGNLGCVAAAVGMFVGGLRVNKIGLSLSIVLGTPKIMIAAMVRQPKILVPIMLNAALLGTFGAIFQIKGTPISAGFGFSGMVGPINAIHFMPGGPTVANLLIIGLVFIAVPFAGGFFFEWICRNVFHLYKAEDYGTEMAEFKKEKPEHQPKLVLEKA